MPSIDTGKVSLYYEETGDGSNPIVLVHGIPTDFRAWNATRPAISNHPSFKLIPFSRRLAYPNKNPRTNESTVQNNTDDLADLIRSLNLAQRVHLVGHSFGGYVSLYCASKHPEIFRSLTLVEPAVPSILVENEKSPLQILLLLLTKPSAALSARRFQRGKLKLCLEAYENGDLQKAVKYFYDGIREKDGAFEELPEDIRDMMNENGPSIGELNLEFPVFTKKDAHEIKLPVLLIKGEKSPEWLRAIVDSLGKSIPNARVVEIPGSGHLPHIERSESFNDALFGFVEKDLSR